MKRTSFYVLAFCLPTLAGCSGCSENGGNGGDTPSKDWPEELHVMVDAGATAQTQAMYKNIYELAGEGTMYGHQIPTLYGLDNRTKWFAPDGETDLSDTKYLIGDHPAVCGWDLAYMELDHTENIDGDVFEEVREHIIAAYERGAVNTISWHMANPVTYKQLGGPASVGSAWDKTNAVKTIVPGGENHEMYKSWLDKIATFLESLKGSEGEAVPVIFRPFHEHTGSGFWWGRGNCTANEFIALWRFTVEYMRDTKGLHNIVWAYSPDMIHLVYPPEGMSPRDIYLEFWPGDNYVDMLGLDAYDRLNSDYAHTGRQIVRLSLAISREKAMPFAITETGIENNDPDDSLMNGDAAQKGYHNEEWWTGMLYKMFEGQRVSFVLLWRNGVIPPGGHYFGAFRGCYTEADFKEFAAKPGVLFESDLPNMYE